MSIITHSAKNKQLLNNSCSIQNKVWALDRQLDAQIWFYRTQHMGKPNSGGISKYSRHREKVKFSTAALHRKESKILEKMYWHLFTFITVDMDRIAQEKLKHIIIFEIGRIMMTLFKFYGFGTSQSWHVKFVVLELNIRINLLTVRILPCLLVG